MAEPDTDSDAEHHDNDTMGMSLYRQMQRVSALQNLERDARRRRGLVMQAMLQDIQRENDMHDSDDEEMGDDVPLSVRLKHRLYDPNSALSTRLRKELEREQSEEADAQQEEEDEEDEEDEEGEDAGQQATRPASSRVTSWAKSFFDCADPARRKCLLPVEQELSNKHHRRFISAKGENRALSRHLKSTYHQSAMKYYAELIDKRGMEPVAAAEETIEEMRRRTAQRSLSFPTGATGSDSKQNLRREIILLSWTLKKGISFQAIDDDLFRLYHKVTEWRRPPSRRRLGDRLLDSLYAIVKQRHKSSLEEADYFSITSDAWTSEAQFKYVGLTLHYVSRDFQLNSLVLSVIPLSVSHTWIHVTEAIAHRITEATPDDAVLVSSVTDNGANFVKMSRSLMTNMVVAVTEGQDVDDWNEPLPSDVIEDDVTGTWSCVDHTIELAVHNTCEEQDFKLLLDRVRNLARYVRSSPDRRKAFREIQEERLIQEKNQAQNQNANDDDADDDNDDDDDDHDDDNHPPLISYLPRSCAEYRRQRRDRLANQKKPWNLILDVPTRWSSTFLMVERFVQLYEDILIYGFRGGLDEYDEYSNGRFIDLSELNTLKSWADALAPVADFVRIGEGEKYATLAWICPLFAHVLECVKPSGGLVAQAEKKFRKKLHGALNDRLGFLLKRVNMALAASALHPAFARLLFVSPRLRNRIWRDLLKCCKEFGELQDSSASPQQQAADIGSPKPFQQIVPPSYDEDQAKYLLQECRKMLEGCTKPTVSLVDMLNYAATNSEYAPLAWWKKVSELGSYRAIIHLPRIIFCTPATSAPSERIFSGGAVVLDSIRACLDEKKVEKLIVCRQFVEKTTPQQLDKLLDEAIDDYLLEFGSGNASNDESRKRRRVT